ncbi:MAG: glycosyltransferase family 2 protein [Deltaproteobacteria bacterium]|nr:glycosyltransferase family 2 protein [Deltaproteobacteria bacterium]
MRISVIVSTYNHPRALNLVLAGLARQTRPADEILVADDGSGAETRALIEAWTRRLPMPLRHVWHPDEGFRKCRILNRAIAAARGDYLVFFDGDCIPSGWCLAVHERRAAPRRYVSGGKVLLDARVSAQLDEAAVGRGVLDRVGSWWLGVEKKRRLIVSKLPGLRNLLDRRVPRPPGWRGENASTWAAHAHAVGGFDERFTYGYEDADFGQRLLLAGVIGVSVRYTAPVYHLEHGRPWRNDAVIAANKALYDANRAQRVVVTPYGLSPQMNTEHHG